MKAYLTIALVALTLLNSCNPNQFFKGVGIEVKTDYGNIYGDDTGIKGRIIVDQRSGK